MTESSGERSFPATEARLRRAREEGQAPLSREVVAAASLGSATLALLYFIPSTMHDLKVQMSSMLSLIDRPSEVALHQVMLSFLAAISPLLILLMAAGSIAVLLQTGFLIKPITTVIEFSRLSPKRGLARIFSLDSTVELLKSIVKSSILAWSVVKGLSMALPDLVRTVELRSTETVKVLALVVGHLLATVMATQLFIVVIDVAWVRFRFSSKLRMSLQEVKQEHREAEGDPVYRSRLKQIRMSRARKRMSAAVAKATVVITNPTHYAVALAYEQGGKSAPRVVAKGVDDVAARIRAAAERHGVSIVPNPPLARSLYTMPIDAEISSEHFKAVAEIIAYVWRLKALTGPRQAQGG